MCNDAWPQFPEALVADLRLSMTTNKGYIGEIWGG